MSSPDSNPSEPHRQLLPSASQSRHSRLASAATARIDHETLEIFSRPSRPPVTTGPRLPQGNRRTALADHRVLAGSSTVRCWPAFPIDTRYRDSATQAYTTLRRLCSSLTAPVIPSPIAARAETCVQAAFRRHLDTTPLAYLRSVRMERAHRDLQNAEPGHGTSVAAVAARWGFTHLGRFAIEYRRRFGSYPSQTLRS